MAASAYDVPDHLAGAIEAEREALASTKQSQALLTQARGAHEALAGYRERRARSRNYQWGEQWGDLVEDEGGRLVAEDVVLRDNGRFPWTMNHIAPAVRNLRGQYRQNRSERYAFAVDKEDEHIADMATQALRHARRINKARTLETDGFNELLMSGMCAFRVSFAFWPTMQREDVLVQRVPMTRLFFNPDLRDRRLLDLRLIGQTHDLTRDEILQAFGGSPARDAALAEAFGFGDDDFDATTYDTADDFSATDSDDFLSASGGAATGRFRVLEVWYWKTKRETYAHDPATGKYGRLHLTDAGVVAENERRAAAGLEPLAIDYRHRGAWHVAFLSPDAHVLRAAETPYEHGEHPFVLVFGEFVDGRARGLVEDLIPHQKLYNRQIGVLDGILSTAARGVLMIPEEMIPEGVTPEQFADEYQKVGGVIVYTATSKTKQALPPHIKPEQIYNNSLPAGAFEWLATMRDNLEYTSGVHGAVMGEQAKSGTAASLYAQQVTQGALTNIDFFECYLEGVRDVDVKTLRVQVQFYDEPRPLRTETGKPVVFEPGALADLDFDVAIGDVTDTAVARMAFEEDLKAFVAQGNITFDEYLEVTGNPKAPIIKQLRAAAAQAQQEIIAAAAGMGAEGIDPALLASLDPTGAAGGAMAGAPLVPPASAAAGAAPASLSTQPGAFPALPL